VGLTITYIQTHLFWEDKATNFLHFDSLLQQVKETDLIVLPEMFTTGFTMNSASMAESENNQTLLWMQHKAKQKNAAITGSFIVSDNHQYYNRLIWVNPDGTYYTYNKRHLFRMAQEHLHYTAGNERLIVSYKGWKICPMICYDLRFPVWSRNIYFGHSKNNQTPTYDLLLFVANWPEARAHAWNTLLPARAIENQCYVLGVNRIGTDGKNINYSGNSAVFDAKGMAIHLSELHREEVCTLQISLSELNEFRQKFPVALDSDCIDISV